MVMRKEVEVGIYVPTGENPDLAIQTYRDGLSERISLSGERSKQNPVIVHDACELFDGIDDGKFDFGFLQVRRNGNVPTEVIGMWVLDYQEIAVVAEQPVWSLDKSFGAGCFHLISNAYHITHTDHQNKAAICFVPKSKKPGALQAIIRHLKNAEAEVTWSETLSLGKAGEVNYLEFRRTGNLWRPEVLDTIDNLTKNVFKFGMYQHWNQLLNVEPSKVGRTTPAMVPAN